MSATLLFAPCLLSVVCCLLQTALGSRYDPHLFPEQGPFFEGWYLRLSDPTQNVSLALLFGKVLPEDHTKAEKLAFVGLLLGRPGLPLENYDHFPSAAGVRITVQDGQPVTGNPDKSSPPDFKWEVPKVGSIEVKFNHTRFDFSFDCASFSGELGAPVPWDDGGAGPEGWLGDLPLPLHWFVYSLRSPVMSYTWRNRCSGDVITGHHGTAHMEKNWGVSFPEGWIWTQGIITTDVSFALTYGPVDFGVATLDGHLVGYRNPSKNINLNFNPTNSLIHIEHSSCNTSVNAKISGLTQILNLIIYTKDNSSFSECLYGPEKNGFRRACRESYTASVEVVVKKRFLWMDTTIDLQTMQYAALEFGGDFTCGNECSKGGN